MTMLPKSITLSAVIFAASAALSVSGAYAGPQSDDVWSQFNNTDGGASYNAYIPERPMVAPTPEQEAQLRQFDAQMQITDGAGNYGANLPDRAIVPATAEQAAQLRQFEAQQKITDGAGGYSASSEESTPSWASARHASSGDVEPVR
jgi:hypothetical protein